MIPIECGEAIEGPDMQAQIIASLAIEPGHRVLEVGTGSGFTAAVLARLAAKVVTVERYRTLAEQARQRFEALGLVNAFMRHADGSQGLPAEAPFDRIVVWAAFDAMPRSFAEQLASNGVMIAPIGPDEGEQVLTKLTKIGSRFEREDIGTVRLQPIAKNIAAVI
ncbi:MAG: protein-L-isoaspartate(D-aspartate) O-methyltransferase, partial [Pseudomonadota bacterium]|nr:protein-L-isoaspartate(D-aspartate) O-methyltransferase [Pseudomonadota bacterium]